MKNIIMLYCDRIDVYEGILSVIFLYWESISI